MIAHFRAGISALDTSSSTLTSDIALNKAGLVSPMGSYLTREECMPRADHQHGAHGMARR